MTDLSLHIGQTLRDLRQQRGWSLDKTAQATGVSKAMLGQIERGESSPTVVTLWRISSGLQASFSEFFTQTVNRRGTCKPSS
jgi:XRE family transcriptional regulator, regulator of sulfur utilization